MKAKLNTPVKQLKNANQYKEFKNYLYSFLKKEQKSTVCLKIFPIVLVIILSNGELRLRI